MRRFRLMPKIAAAIVSATMILSGAVPAFAATDSVKGGSISFDNYLVIPSKAHIPTKDFTFTVSAGSGKEAGTNSQVVKPGVDVNNVKVGKASFSKETIAYDKVQNNDDITLAQGKKYAKTSVSVDFSNVTFTSTGIYRYILTQANDDSNYTVENSNSKALDVYVTRNTNGDLAVETYILHSGVEDEVSKTPNYTKKIEKFENTYVNSHNISFQKNTTGNQRNPDDEFKFTLEIANAIPNTRFAAAAQATNKETSNITYIDTDDTGSASQVIYLKAGDRFAVYALNNNASYTVTEDATTNSKLGYSLTGIEWASTAEDKTNLSNNAVRDDKLTGNADFSFVNDKGGTVPTGVIFAVAPFAIGAVAIAAFVILKVRKAVKQ